MHVHVLLACVSLCYCVWGTLYVFPIWLADIKSEFNLTQQELNVIGAGVYLGHFRAEYREYSLDHGD
jgi:hypothetical protein